jgi:CDP-diacylglycerol--serine O-phosphatidyltransferase
MKIVLKQIPNIITAANLLMGCMAILAALNHNLVQAAYFIGLAAIFDFFDGFAARLLKVNSEIGKQLDSLADVVSFGVAPGMIFYIHSSYINDALGVNANLNYLAFLIPIFSAFRLAKFNIDTRQSDSFIGLPTPANALFICAIPLVFEHGPTFATNFFSSSIFIYTFPLVSSWLLMAELPLFALKFKSFKWAGNEIRWLFIGLSCCNLLFFQYFGISLSILLYLTLSIYLFYKQKSHEIQS